MTTPTGHAEPPEASDSRPGVQGVPDEPTPAPPVPDRGWWRQRLRIALAVLSVGVAVNLTLWLWLGWSVPARQAAAGYSESDSIFATLMVEHHAQAIEVASLAAGRATDPEVLATTEAISASSVQQIEAHSAWLRERGIPVPAVGAEALAVAAGDASTAADDGSGPRVPGTDGHGHGEGYPDHGMLTVEQVDVIASLEGVLFELHLLDGLVRHHEGALQLAEDEVYAGEDADAVELAREEADITTAELATLRELLGPKMVARSAG
ncbi:DUF305 domain-containing protein [Antribacter sp. KLBMP9083]|uniref:DUF305 domain-containing protein n=1 Tax=Antribacter soli TaxID=2910976 RepID=A0AA41QDG2_9MICO|nr:DUF305 domain-containing protein [Antribacter soli]MCF4120576.1 DUF305 domain-containing protein [Antribacter soli]